MKLGISSRSYDQALEEKTLDLPALFAEADTLNVKFIEAATAYFPTANEVFLNELSLVQRRTSVRLACLKVSNDFAYPDSTERERQVLDLVTWMDVAVRLRAPCISMLTGNPSPGVAPDRAQSWVSECLHKLIAPARQRCIRLALENHGSLFNSPQACLKLVRQIDPQVLGLSLHTDGMGRDAGKLAEVLPHVLHVRMTFTDDGPDVEPEVLVPALRSIGYGHMLSLEYWGAGRPKEALARVIEKVGCLLK